MQARGQLRLTWRLYAESPQSGEISLRNVASPWWQEISRLCVSLEPKIFTPYRRVPPLEMTMPAGSIQSFPGDKLPQTLPRTPVISTAAKRSGEISLRNVANPWWQEISRLCVSLEPKIFAPYRQVPPLEMTMPAGSIQSFQGTNYKKRCPALPSFRPKRSGVEKSHSEMWQAHGGRRSLGSAFH